MKRLAIALAVILPLAASSPALADEPIVIKFSHVVAPDAPKGKAALFFKELAEKYTNGRVKVEVYPNSSLYKDKEELEALQLGSVQLLAPSIAKFSPLGVKEFDIFDLPFLLSDEAHARQMMASPMMAELNKKLEAKGVRTARLLGQRRAQLHRQQAAGLAGRLPRHENAHSGRQGAGRGGARARRHSADHRLRRTLSGAADRRRRRRGQCRLEHPDAEILRSAEAHDAVAPQPADLCARHQQDVLELAAG